MTFGELQSDVRVRLDDSDTVFYTDQDIKDAVNEAYFEMVDATECYERQATLTLLSGRSYYDLSTLLPDTFLSPRRAFNTTTQKWLRPTDCRDQDTNTFVQWELTYGSPQAYLMRGNWWLGVWPRSTSDAADKLRFYYTAIPPEMSDSADEPVFPREFHPGITALALADLLAQQHETKKALAHWAKGQLYVVALQAHVDGRQRLAKKTVLS